MWSHSSLVGRPSRIVAKILDALRYRVGKSGGAGDQSRLNGQTRGVCGDSVLWSVTLRRRPWSVVGWVRVPY